MVHQINQVNRCTRCTTRKRRNSINERIYGYHQISKYRKKFIQTTQKSSKERKQKKNGMLCSQHIKKSIRKKRKNLKQRCVVNFQKAGIKIFQSLHQRTHLQLVPPWKSQCPCKKVPNLIGRKGLILARTKLS